MPGSACSSSCILTGQMADQEGSARLSIVNIYTAVRLPGLRVHQLLKALRMHAGCGFTGTGQIIRHASTAFHCSDAHVHACGHAR